MSIKKLPETVKSLLSSSASISTYRRAIEELVYNSLDASSTSIAIRVHIEENKIQVIDNGQGITECDFHLLGQRHTTSKCVDLNTLKSAANTYGYRGQSLANIINISQNVQITSRSDGQEVTWLKIFHEGKTKELIETTMRPSKGTTVEIKGFLYNLHIQRKAVQTLIELNEIKTFIQQFSLIHCDVSLSLRDDAKNEIIFKAQKNRDVCQTIKLLFSIDPHDIQQFSVEKNEYKVKAYIVKKYKDTGQIHWIYLNGKFLSNCILHKIINEKMKKSWIKPQMSKTKGNMENEEIDCMNKIPFYLILLSCPYYDYDISHTPKQTILEFKSWNEITKLLNKLIKFYIGDDNLMKRLEPKKKLPEEKVDDTREQVRKIVQRLLKKNIKNVGVSQMQNSVKGKSMKRKIKKKQPNISFSKVIPPKIISVVTTDKKSDSIIQRKSNEIHDNKKEGVKNVVKLKNLNITKKKHKKRTKLILKNEYKKKISDEICNNYKFMSKSPTMKEHNSDLFSSNINSTKSRKEPRNENLNERNGINKINLDKDISIVDALNSFNVSTMLDITMQQSAENLEVNETAKNKNKQCSYIIDNQNTSLWKKIDEITIHNFLPHPLKSTQLSHNVQTIKKGNENKECYISSHNILKTILSAQQCNVSTISKGSNPSISRITYQPCNFNLKSINPSITSNGIFISKLTYESHNYNRNDNPQNMCTSKNKKSKCQFITMQSRNNFLNREETYTSMSKNKKPRIVCKQSKIKGNKINKANKRYEVWKGINSKSYTHESKYTIEFSKNAKNLLCDQIDSKINASKTPLIVSNVRKNETIDMFSDKENCISESIKADIDDEDMDNTHLILSNHIKTGSHRIFNENFALYTHTNNRNETICDGNKNKNHKTYSNEVNNNKSANCEIIQNVIVPIDIESNISLENIQPIDVCESIIKNKIDDILRKEFELSFKCNNQNKTFHSILPKNASMTDLYEIEHTIMDETSRHFKSFPNNEDNSTKKSYNPIILNKSNEVQTNCENIHEEYGSSMHGNIDNVIHTDLKNFNMQTRFNFIPKGLSPIFQNCYTNNACECSFEKDYFENNVYHNFMNNVNIGSEIFKPILHNTSNMNTKCIERVKTKLQKENASITFDATALKCAKVLGQVDNKFIAAIVKPKSELTNCLVLFDQHAVHERIRLETNLSDYFNGYSWKSVNLDELSIKLPEDDLLYLHNYKDKFTCFGLAYTILNKCEISVNAIPEAILGKNARNVRPTFFVCIFNLLLSNCKYEF
ncbi:DNA mismatch repair protein Mlh3-like isoform X4 [Achroia grisella]|uniref:DNA mismatch repair protein Mlh3-like isoform X4 n=1 Tax=Achroia grisella TaxID=688607 RepID=UPI0027D2080C|nr:DNA mismatch repair protein Mlh3-like isoform X4 [Achroia grisella]